MEAKLVVMSITAGFSVVLGWEADAAPGAVTRKDLLRFIKGRYISRIPALFFPS